ncbi:MAG: redoxin domain-containing protein [Acidobacteria bacterium]|nr:redoxin domain-containing protein [Acidobacteriota bacterium]
MRKRFPALIAILFLLPFCRAVNPQEDGRQWIDRVAQAYGELQSYRFEGATKSKIYGFSNTSKTTPFVRYGKPKENKFRYQTGIGRSVCVIASDGMTTTACLGDNLQYAQKNSSDIATDIAAFFKNAAGAYLGSALPGDYSVLGPKISRTVILGREKVRLKSTRVDCIVVEAEIIPETPSLHTQTIRTLWIDPDSSVVLRDIRHFQATSPKGKVFIDSTEEMRVSSYRINEEIEDSVFQFTPPRNAYLSEALDLSYPDSGLAIGPPTDTLQLSDLDGRSYTFEEMKGQIALLDFWATWCVPCRKEMQSLEKIHQRFKDRGLIIFGVNRESGQVQSDFLKKKPFTYPMLLDQNGDLTRRFNAVNLPTLVLIDRQGRIAAWEQGLLKEEELEGLLKPLGIQ